MNPRYIAYATAHGRDVWSMDTWDRGRFPGGYMAGFVIWLTARWEDYRALRRIRRSDPIGDEMQVDFDRWLWGYDLNRETAE